jgi:hypothetical protein
MSIVLLGTTSGSCTLQEQAIAGTTTLTLPTTSGTVVATSSAVSAAGQIPFSTDGSTYTPTAKIVSGTAVASTSGTSIDFTSIPSWVKRITVMFNGVGTNGTSNMQIQVGISTGVVATGYTSGIGYRNGEATSTTGFVVGQMINNTLTFQGVVTINSFGSNIWTSGGTLSRNDGWAVLSGGFVTNIGGTLDRIRITTVNGTDTFDAGSINILYE